MKAHKRPNAEPELISIRPEAVRSASVPVAERRHWFRRSASLGRARPAGPRFVRASAQMGWGQICARGSGPPPTFQPLHRRPLRPLQRLRRCWPPARPSRRPRAPRASFACGLTLGQPRAGPRRGRRPAERIDQKGAACEDRHDVPASARRLSVQPRRDPQRSTSIVAVRGDPCGVTVAGCWPGAGP